MSKNPISRREFLARSAAGAALYAVSGAVGIAPSKVMGANERLGIGVIGVGSRGEGLMKEAITSGKALNAEVIAVCDTWKINREKAASVVKERSGHEPRQFSNYEDLLALPEVDAVIIATPDFAHCPVLCTAVKAGKDSFVEKPLCRNLEEAKEAFDTVKATGRIVQVGTQRRSEGKWKALATAIQDGVLGKITRVEIAWNDCNPRWRRNVTNCKPVDVDWKQFQMGKYDREFCPHRYREWQLYRDYSLGPIGVLGSHYIDVVNWFMDDPYPTSAVGNGGIYLWNDGREHEDTLYVIYDYPKGFMCRLLVGLGNSAESGCRIYGTNGMFDEMRGFVLTGAGGKGEGLIKEERKIQGEPNESHVRNFLECVRSRKQPNAPIEAGYAHAVGSVLGYEALTTGKKLKYVPESRSIVEA